MAFDADALTCSVTRVTRPDTLMIRTVVPQLQSKCTVYMRLAGVDVKPGVMPRVLDWLEVHGHFGLYQLDHCDWLRDEYGRLLGDLADRVTGDTLAGHLIKEGLAFSNPSHVQQVMATLLTSAEPEE